MQVTVVYIVLYIPRCMEFYSSTSLRIMKIDLHSKLDEKLTYILNLATN